jgi:hypothetical protein
MESVLVFVGSCVMIYFVGLCFVPSVPSETGKAGSKKA